MSDALTHAKAVVVDYEIDQGSYDYSDAIRALSGLIRAYEALEARKLTVTVNVNGSVIDPEAVSQTIKRALDAPNSPTT